MLKKLLTTIAVATTLLITSSAGAATFDFKSWADNNADPNYQGETGGDPITGTVEGITLNAYGQWQDNQAFAYLDAGNAGLGVCKTLNGSQCTPSNDDNVTEDETLWLDFGQVVDIDDMDFRDANHNVLALGGFDLFDDGGFINSFLFGSDFSALGLSGDVFGFRFHDEEFYIETMTVSAVPLPAALPLFGAALLGMGYLGRRRKNRAQIA